MISINANTSALQLSLACTHLAGHKNSRTLFSKPTSYCFTYSGILKHSSSLFCLRQTPARSKQCQWKLFCAEQEAIAPDCLKDAQEGVADLLSESGISKEDAVAISKRALKYTRMLADAVLELDTSNLWNSWQKEGEDEASGHQIVGSTFKEKVLYVARRKDAKGIAPFLESLGVKFSSVLYLSRYLSQEPLSSLIEKINYLKELLDQPIHGTDNISSKIQRMMSRLSISADDDLQKTLSFFEKMQAQRGGLTTLESPTDTIARLIESFPMVLLRSVRTHIKPLEDFLENIGIPEQSLGIIFLSYPPLLLYDVVADIQPRLHTLKKVGICREETGKMLLRYPWLVNEGIVDNIDAVIDFFIKSNMPGSKVKRVIIGCPQLLGSSTMKMGIMMDLIKRTVKKTASVPSVIASSPVLFLRGAHEFNKVVLYLQEIGLDSNKIGKLLRRCPEIFGSDVESTLQRKVEFLLSLGICDGQLQRIVDKYPDVLVRGVDQSLKPRIEYLQHVGFSRSQVVFMLNGFPQLLGYSLEVLQPKIEYLINDMSKSIDEAVAYPRYFSYSLEEKIKPRFRVLKHLKVQCDLKTMLAKNDDEFAQAFLGVGRMLVPPVYDLE